MRRLTRLRVAIPVLVVLAMAASAVYVYAGRGGAATQYRTGTAVLGTVTQTLPLSGNLTAVNQTDLDFSATGKVQSVKVTAGQAVHAGDVLASLDATSL